MSFVHLHVHSEYSLLDGAARINSIIDRAVSLGMDSIAITDHGVMYGAVDFYKAAKAKGIKAIIGCEVYVSPRSMEEKSGRADKEYSHLVLLAQNERGYKNLIKLVSLGFTQGFYYKPRIDYDLLEQYSEGLVCLSACLAGDIPQALLQDRKEDAVRLALRLKDMFPDRFYIELQDHAIYEEKKVLPQLIELARELEIPMVATNDTHYCLKEDAKAHDVLLCIQTASTITDVNRMKFSTEEFYIKSEEEMRALFPHVPEAIENTVRIAEQCNFSYEFGNILLPVFEVPDGKTPYEYMKQLTEEGIIRCYGRETPEIRQRIDYELEMIHTMGYVEYYLIVWDFIHYAKEHGIMVGPGRGSGAGSLAAYLMGITNIDPLKYNLLFERFLNPERISMPDFDVDFCYERRGEVIDYVIEKYGADHVAQIITFGTMAAKGAIRDVGRVMGVPYAEVDRIAKMVPGILNITLEKALEMSDELRADYETNEQTRAIYDMAMQVEGLPRHSSTHAAGVVISNAPVDTLVPVALNDGGVTTQFTMKILEQLGLLKMDFLGLRTLTVIRDTLDLIEINGKERPDMDRLDMQDQGTFDLISQGDTDGVFQLESGGMRSFIKELKPQSLEDIIAGISLYRPGPMDSIPTYIRNKNHPEQVQYLHPLLEPILNVTYGCMVYQEQVMQIVRDVGGYSLGRSDLVRRAMGKKDARVMEQERHIFIHGLEENGQIKVCGAIRNGVDEKTATEIFDQMQSFAQYAFNKSHAAAYAVVAYQTAYLKRYYTAEFMAALLNSFLGNFSKAAQYIQYCRQNGIEISPPDINASTEKFTVEGNRIRVGLAAIKNIGIHAVHALVAERKKGAFKSFIDFCERMDGGEFNKRAVEGLIQSGVFDSLGYKRAALMACYEGLMDAVQNRKKRAETNQIGMFELLGEDAGVTEDIPNINEYPTNQLLALEKEALGIFVSGHPLDEYAHLLSNYKDTTEMLQQDPETGMARISDHAQVEMAGIITQKKDKITKNGSKMAFITLEDLYGDVEVLIFPAVLSRFAHIVQPDRIVAVQGRISTREEEEPKLIAESFRLLEKGETPAPVKQAVPDAEYHKVWIRLNSNESEKLEKIYQLAQQCRGNDELILYFADTAKKGKAPLSIAIDDRLIDGLNEIAGTENIKLV